MRENRLISTVPRPKVQIPRPPDVLLSRPRLSGLLPGGVDGSVPIDGPQRLVYEVCAPAGYGKTTLLAAHARQLYRRGVVVAWVTIDRHDNDPVRLWTAVLSGITRALDRVAEHLDGAVGDLITHLAAPQHELGPAFLAAFLDAVEALPGPLVLVLDDVHLLTDEDALAVLVELLRHQPDRLVPMFGCRHDPALSLPRLRLSGRLREVRATDLSFTADEAARLFAALDIDLDDAGLSTMLARTEGWPAALRLAALSMADEQDPRAFVTAFAGDDRAVADYLVAEVLARCSPSARRFVLDTCVAEQVTPQLATAMSGRTDAGAQLEQLARANALVTRIGRGPWYRYHGLLRSYLLADLAREGADEPAERHARAAEWFAAEGTADAAVSHAVASGRPTLAVAYLRRFGLQLLLSGAGAVVHDALDGAPVALHTRPEVALLSAIDALDRGDLPAADRLIGRVRDGDLDGDRWLARLRYAARLYRARLTADVSVLDDPSPADDQPVAAATGEADEDVELLVLANRGTLRIAAGDMEGARADLRTALAIARRGDRDYLVLHCLNQLSGLAVAFDDLPAMRRESGESIDFAEERGWAASPRMAYAYTVAGWTAHLLLDPDAAATWVTRATAVLGPAMTPEVERAARSAEAVIAFDRPRERRAAFRRMCRLWAEGDGIGFTPTLTAYAMVAGARMCLTLGMPNRARAVADHTDALLGDHADPAVLRALVLLARNRLADARRAVVPTLTGRAVPVVRSHTVLAWLIEAVAASRAGEHTRGHEAVMTALELGEAHGALRPFYDMGRPVLQLLVGAADRTGSLEPFRTRLLAAWDMADDWQARHADIPATTGGAVRLSIGSVPARPLTLRELDVLRELPSMLTLEEIADAHVISVNTVKTHLKSIYRKLEVGSRRDAVAVGRAVGLL